MDDKQEIRYITKDEVTELMNEAAKVQFSDMPMGYNKSAVDAFLDKVAQALYEVTIFMQHLEDEEKPERIAMPEPLQVEPPKAMPAPEPVSDESLKEVLTMAVQLKNQVISEAQTKADAILAAAKEEAERRVGDLSREEEELKERVAALKQTAADYREAFEQLLQAQQDALDKADGLF